MNPLTYPMLHRILSDFKGPLFEGASVTVDSIDEEGHLTPDPESARLHLKPLSAQHASEMPKEITMKVGQTFQDQQMIETKIIFTFRVYDLSFTKLPDGFMKPLFKQELKEYARG